MDTHTHMWLPLTLRDMDSTQLSCILVQGRTRKTCFPHSGHQQWKILQEKKAMLCCYPKDKFHAGFKKSTGQRLHQTGDIKRWCQLSVCPLFNLNKIVSVRKHFLRAPYVILSPISLLNSHRRNWGISRSRWLCWDCELWREHGNAYSSQQRDSAPLPLHGSLFTLINLSLFQVRRENQRISAPLRPNGWEERFSTVVVLEVAAVGLQRKYAQKQQQSELQTHLDYFVTRYDALWPLHAVGRARHALQPAVDWFVGGAHTCNALYDNPSGNRILHKTKTTQCYARKEF